MFNEFILVKTIHRIIKMTVKNSDLCESRLEWLPETESGEETEPRPDFCFACVRMWDFRLVDCANFLLHPWQKHQNEKIEENCARQNLKGADVGAVSGVYAHVCPQVEVEWESLSTALKSALERLLPRVLPLVGIQFWLGEKSFPTAFAEQLVVSSVSPHVTH